MKLMFKLTLLLFAVLFISCKGQLELVKSEEMQDQNYPDFNFNFRYYRMQNDTLNLLENDSINTDETNYIELYINQIELEKKNVNYTIQVSVSGKADATFIYEKTEYRPGDPIIIKYDKFKNNKILLEYIPLTKGQYDIVLICSDMGNHSKSFSKSITIY